MSQIPSAAVEQLKDLQEYAQALALLIGTCDAVVLQPRHLNALLKPIEDGLERVEGLFEKRPAPC